MRPLTTILLLGMIGALCYLGLIFAMQRSVLFPRPAVPGPSPAGSRADVDVVWLGPGGGVEAWYLPARHPLAPGPALIFAHGNGELIDLWLEAFEVPRAWGLGILLVEYPGYGRSAGRPTEESISRAMRDAWDFLAARPEVDRERIVAYGRSVGGGAACALARERDLGGLILESAFTSVRDLARRFGLFGPLVLDPFDNLATVGTFEGPVLVIHGENDRTIPPSHGRALAVGTPSAELVLLPCGHNDCPRPWEIVRSFLSRHGFLPEAPGAE